MTDSIQGRLKLKVRNFSQFCGDLVSEPVLLNGFAWNILVRSNKEKVGFFLQCKLATTDSNNSWSCRAKALFLIHSRNSRSSDFERRIDKVFNALQYGYGYEQCLHFEELADPSNGYIHNDKITFRIFINTSEIQIPKCNLERKDATLALDVVDFLENHENLIIIRTYVRDLMILRLRFGLMNLFLPTFYKRVWRGPDEAVISLKWENSDESIRVKPQYLINLWEFLRRHKYMLEPTAKDEKDFEKLLNSATIPDYTRENNLDLEKSNDKGEIIVENEELVILNSTNIRKDDWDDQNAGLEYTEVREKRSQTDSGAEDESEVCPSDHTSTNERPMSRSKSDHNSKDESQNNSSEKNSEIMENEELITTQNSEDKRKDDLNDQITEIEYTEVVEKSSQTHSAAEKEQTKFDDQNPRKRKMDDSDSANKILRPRKMMTCEEYLPLAALISGLVPREGDTPTRNAEHFEQNLQECLQSVGRNPNAHFVPRFIRAARISSDQFLIVCTDQFSFDWLQKVVDRMRKVDFPHAKISLLTSRTEDDVELIISFSIPNVDRDALDRIIDLLKIQNPRLNVVSWNFVSMSQNQAKSTELMFKVAGKSVHELVSADFRIFYDLNQIRVNIVDQSVDLFEK